MKYAELFAGYGGLGMAIERVFGAELEWYAEFEDAPSKIMACQWPEASNHGDVTEIEWDLVEPVDIISGGSPCQDVSAAGKRAGMAEGTRSNLWVSMREAIQTIRPQYVIWENVRGALSAKATSESDVEPGDGQVGGVQLRALGRVLGDLSTLGYDAQWRVIRASSVGAPHRRERVFVLAWRSDIGVETPIVEVVPPPGPKVKLLPTIRAVNGTSGRLVWKRGGKHKKTRNLENVLYDTLSTPLLDVPSEDYRSLPAGEDQIFQDWGEYTPAIRRWEEVLGRPAPEPTKLNGKGRHQISEDFAEWYVGLPEGHLTAAEGITPRDVIKAAGNGVVPQQAEAALREMLVAKIEDDLL